MDYFIADFPRAGQAVRASAGSVITMSRALALRRIVALIGGVVILEAGPVYSYLSAKAFRQPIEPTQMVLGFGAAALLCIVATLLPIRIALKRLEAVER